MPAIHSSRPRAILPKSSTDSRGGGQQSTDYQGQALPQGNHSASFRWEPVQVMEGICCRCGYSKHADTWRQCQAECFVCCKDEHHGQECPEQKDPHWYGDNGPRLSKYLNGTSSGHGSLPLPPFQGRNFPVAPSGRADLSLNPAGTANFIRVPVLRHPYEHGNFPQGHFDQPQWAEDHHRGHGQSRPPTFPGLPYHNHITVVQPRHASDFGINTDERFTQLSSRLMQLEFTNARLRTELERDRTTFTLERRLVHDRIARLEDMLGRPRQQQQQGQQAQVKLEDQDDSGSTQRPVWSKY